MDKTLNSFLISLGSKGYNRLYDAAENYQLAAELYRLAEEFSQLTPEQIESEIANKV